METIINLWGALSYELAPCFRGQYWQRSG